MLWLTQFIETRSKNDKKKKKKIQAVDIILYVLIKEILS